MRTVLHGVVLTVALLLPAIAHAVEPSEMLADPKLEARARTLSLELRCLVCQNQSIDDSNADLARDLRLLVRERIVAGDSDDAVKAFIVQRYGKFVLLKPPLELDTVFLWLTPFLVLGTALLIVARRFRSAPLTQGGRATAPLTAEEEERLGRLLAENLAKGTENLETASRK
jgi:cytochrome c-type biogenesis protein CcmH